MRIAWCGTRSICIKRPGIIKARCPYENLPQGIQARSTMARCRFFGLKPTSVHESWAQFKAPDSFKGQEASLESIPSWRLVLCLTRI